MPEYSTEVVKVSRPVHRRLAAVRSEMSARDQRTLIYSEVIERLMDHWEGRQRPAIERGTGR